MAQKSLFGPRSGESVGLWILKVFSGLFIFLILAMHFMVNHLVSPNGLQTYAEIVKYYQNPTIVGMEILFVIFVVGHSLLGLRGILLDLKPKPAVVKVFNWIFVGVGLAAVIYGVSLILLIANRGAV